MIHACHLSHIFYKQFDKVVKNCNYYLINHDTLESPHISRIMEGTFLYFSSKSTTVQILCKSSPHRTDVLLQQGMNILRIKGQCKVSGTQFYLESSDDIISRIDPSRLPTSLTNTTLEIEFQKYASNMNFHNLSKIPFIKKENLALLLNTAIEQLKIENANNAINETSWLFNLHEYAPYIIGIVLAIAIGILIIYYCKRVPLVNQHSPMYIPTPIPMLNLPSPAPNAY